MSLPYGYSLIPFSCLKLLEPQLQELITDDMSISSPFQSKVEQVFLNYALAACSIGPFYSVLKCTSTMNYCILAEGMVTNCCRIVIAHRCQCHGTGGTSRSHVLQPPSQVGCLPTQDQFSLNCILPRL